MKRCAYCRHRLDIDGDPETRAVHVHLVPSCRRNGTGDVRTVVACHLCAASKGPMTGAEYRKVLAFPTQRKQWLQLIHRHIAVP